MPKLYTARARERAAARALAHLSRWAVLAVRRLARLKLGGRGRSPAAAWLSDLIDRLGDALRRVRAWAATGVTG